MRLIKLSVFAIGIIVLAGCKTPDSYRIDAAGNSIAVNFVNYESLRFPASEADEAIERLFNKVKLEEHEKILDITVFKNQIVINTVIESSQARKKRLARFSSLSKGAEGRVFVMKKINGFWFVTDERKTGK